MAEDKERRSFWESLIPSSVERQLPDDATSDQHLKLARIKARERLGGRLMWMTAGSLAVLVFYLPNDPSAALTALLGAVAGYLGASLKDIIASVSGKED